MLSKGCEWTSSNRRPVKSDANLIKFNANLSGELTIFERDHHPFGFTMWMAGGGIKGGASYGETDEIGYHAAVDRTSVHDIHATILHQMGINHKQLTYHFSGRDFRLTDVAGKVIDKIIA